MKKFRKLSKFPIMRSHYKYSMGAAKKGWHAKFEMCLLIRGSMCCPLIMQKNFSMKKP